MSLHQSAMNRRQFIRNFARTCFGVSILPNLLGAETTESPTAKSVIYLYLRGGLSHVDTLDPKPGRPEMGGVEAINTSTDGIQIGAWFPKLAKQMHHITLVRSMTSTQGVHDRGNYLARTSYFQTPTITHPTLGAWALQELGTDNQQLPGNILINGSSNHPGGGYFPTQLSPLPIPDPGEGLPNASLPNEVSPKDFQRRIQLAGRLSRDFVARTPHRDAAGYRQMRDDARKLMQSEDLKAFDIGRENPKTLDSYGSSTFGQGCVLARRLVEQGVRWVEVEEGQNWDTHNLHVDAMRKMTPTADQAMAALLEDLHQRGLLDTTLVVMATEFGRTPKFDANTAGRGHHPAAFSWWLAGGGIKGGYVYGATDEAGQRVADMPVTMPDFNATIAQAIGIDLQKEHLSPSGRPFTVANKGKPIAEVLA
jgi:hypothetical protein